MDKPHFLQIQSILQFHIRRFENDILFPQQRNCVQLYQFFSELGCFLKLILFRGQLEQILSVLGFNK